MGLEFFGALLDWDTDYLARLHNFVSSIGVEVLTRENWSDRCVITDGSIAGLGPATLSPREDSELIVAPFFLGECSFGGAFRCIRFHVEGRGRARWVSLSHCRISRIMRPLPDPERAILITSHCALGFMAMHKKLLWWLWARVAVGTENILLLSRTEEAATQMSG